MPVAIGIAFCLEAMLVAMAALGLRESSAVPPPPPHPQVVRLVAIADHAGALEPSREPSKSATKPTAAPPRHQSHRRPQAVVPPVTQAAPSPAPAPIASSPQQAKTDEVPATAQPTHADHSDERHGGVRRGLVPLVRVTPDYPPRALAGNIEGLVVVHATISADGSVTAAKVVSAQPPGIFEREAIRAIMQWRFSPNDGGFVGEIELRFSLND
ncbi:energy transducer TonB [Paraburkholderia caledonica]|uniref:Protein TonB n=1 Tax=Paraburkholderia caledonica TaxID=134536 RepID=A0AB73ING9_9BURK|nr:protein TonB [Paraburkholderia caledonica]